MNIMESCFKNVKRCNLIFPSFSIFGQQQMKEIDRLRVFFILLNSTLCERQVKNLKITFGTWHAASRLGSTSLSSDIKIFQSHYRTLALR